MTAMFINIIPEFRHDQAVQRLMVASTSSNLSAAVDMSCWDLPEGHQHTASRRRVRPPVRPAGSVAGGPAAGPTAGRTHVHTVGSSRSLASGTCPLMTASRSPAASR
jgi:hypothetical protein